MPPFGKSDSNILYSSSVRSTSSFFQDEMLDMEGGIMSPKDLPNLVSQLQAASVSVDLVNTTREFLLRAFELENRFSKYGESFLINKAISNSIRYAEKGVLDRIAALFESQDSDLQKVFAGLTKADVLRANCLFDRLEQLKFETSEEKFEKLEIVLRDLMKQEADLSAQHPHDLRELADNLVRVSVLSSSLSFEYLAGPSERKQLTAEASDSLPLSIKLSPFLFVRAKDMLENSAWLQLFRSCTIKIDLCYHRKLFASSGSGIVGEAVVRAHITPLNDSRNSKSWTSDCLDIGKLRVAEVRATQMNAFPRTTQTMLDVFISSSYGLSGLIITTKMRTYYSVNDEAPDMEIQLVMEPPPKMD